VVESHLQDQLRADLEFERTANQSYADMLRYLDSHDVTTAQLLVSILATQEKHIGALEALVIPEV
jgi:bacterioferritin (cytochrome b1)